MKNLLKIGLVLFVGSVVFTSCDGKKGKSSSIGDIFEDKISVSMQSKILAVARNKEIKFYEFKKEGSANIEKTEVFKTKFSQDIDEIEFLPFSYILAVRSKDSLKLHEYDLSQKRLDLVEKFHIPSENIDNMAIGDGKILVREGLNLKEFKKEKGVFTFVKGTDLKKENQIEKVNEMSRLGEYIAIRNENTLQTIKDDERIKLMLPEGKIDEIFFNDWGMMGIRMNNDIKFYEAKKDTLIYLPQFDFKIK